MTTLEGECHIEFDIRVKLEIYRSFAASGEAPSVAAVAAAVDAQDQDVRSAFTRLRDLRVLALGADGMSIRMAPPFSGVPTQHVVNSDGVRYYANCAWDALGIPAALARPAVVHSTCGQSGDPLILEVSPEAPPQSDWLFHCLVPAASWWDDIVFT